MDFLLRLDFRLEVSGIAGGDFSFSPALPDEGLSKISGELCMKIDGQRTLALPWLPAAGRFVDEDLEGLALMTPQQLPFASLLV